MKYAMPCDHCGSEIITAQVYRISKTEYWQCTNCGCIWTLDWVLKEKGYQCPVHGPDLSGLRQEKGGDID